MQIQRYFAIARFGAVNGLGLGVLLEGLRQFQNLTERYELLLNPHGISTYDSLRWHAIPTFASIGMAMVSLLLFTLFPSLSKHVVWSWVLVGLAGFSIALIGAILLSSNGWRAFVHSYPIILRAGGVTCLYQAWFGVVLLLGTQRK